MGSYRSEDEALVGLARQLTDAYGEARTREDQDYACDAIAEYLSEFRDTAPDEALLAILDLPLTAETYPLVDEVQVTLAGRGPGVVALLLAAALGDVYDPDGPAPERAAETIGLMRAAEASAGLCRVLCGGEDGQIKSAAVEALVTLGDVAEGDLLGILDDPAGGDWAAAALEQLRYVREHGDPLAGEAGMPRRENAEDEDRGAPESAAEGAAGETASAPGRDVGGTESVPGQPAGAAGPDKGLVDEAFDEFRRRFERESGEEPTTP